MAPRTPIKIPMEAEPEAGGGVSVPSEPPRPLVRRPAPVTNAIALGQQLADALGAARALINRTPTDSAVLVDQLRRWYYGQIPHNEIGSYGATLKKPSRHTRDSSTRFS